MTATTSTTTTTVSGFSAVVSQPHSTEKELATTTTAALLAQKDAEIQTLRTQLALLSEGMRLVATQIRNADRQGTEAIVQTPKSVEDDCTTVATESCSGEETVVSTGSDTAAVLQTPARTTSSVSTTTTKTTATNGQGQLEPTELRLTEIMQDLTRAQTADLMALQNAVRIVQQHASLATQEAVWAVQDSVEAQRLVQTWQTQTNQMKKRCAKIQARHTDLTARNAKLTAEKRVLIQEVRKLRHQESSSQQFHTTVWQAMQLHQEHLKQKTLEIGSDNLSQESATNTSFQTPSLDQRSILHAESEDEVKESSSSSTSKMSTPPSSPVNLHPRMEVPGAAVETHISPITPGFPTTPPTGGGTTTTEQRRRNHRHPPPNEDLMMPRTIF